MKKLLFLTGCIAVGLSGAFAADPDAPVRPADYPAPVRVACIGASITQGVGTRVPQFDSYPAQLQRMLGEKWVVGNFGNSSSTLLQKGDKPYQKQESFKSALGFRPNVVVISLGGNDSKPQNWRYNDEFTSDYKNLIGQFKALASHPRIFVCRPALVAGNGNFGISQARVDEQMPMLESIAREEGAGLIDMHAPLVGHEEMLPDRVHPNNDGANRLARAAYRALTGCDFSGEMEPFIRSDWNGFQRLDFMVGDRQSLLVLPKNAAPGRPWIWRTEFFGHEPQGDIALLNRGWHVAYTDIKNLYGAPVALDAMDKFHASLTRDHHLASKVVLEGFSRGGLFAFNWAARNPASVAAIYGDAPVLDFKSWPAGKGKSRGSPGDWTILKTVYGFADDAVALAYGKNPVDNLAPLADAHIPILCVVGDADRTVPVVENTGLAETRYKALGGEMLVIHKPGVDHHPHSLKDPTPIVDFITTHFPKP